MRRQLAVYVYWKEHLAKLLNVMDATLLESVNYVYVCYAVIMSKLHMYDHSDFSPFIDLHYPGNHYQCQVSQVMVVGDCQRCKPFITS